MAIYNSLSTDYMPVPSTPEEWLEIAREFDELWNFPNCVGAIDGKHIVMRKPHHGGSMYHNYKGQESIVLMAIVDAKQRFVLFKLELSSLRVINNSFSSQSIHLVAVLLKIGF